MPTPAAVMTRRLRAFEARAVGLRQRITALEEEAAQVDREIARWRIGSEIWDEVEQELRGDAGEAAVSRSPSDNREAPADAEVESPAGAGADAGTGAGGESRYVPQRQEDSDPSRLPGLYSKIVEFVREAREPVRAREVAQALLGEGAGRSRQEGVPCQLKRLVQRDWLTSADGREFTAAG
ncbi:hypothetical protein [Streptomyces sp. NBRC 110035]|uniref:hypothetical protein n=1 Tax=Streptomyces sp. NBRC 110035 TaxID=1547867 RepID=UPI0005A6F619|nr:hypothetical protein [Streptomyces sp. NBRC 110035]